MADPVNLEGIRYLLPLFSFLIVFVVSFVVINKSKVVEQPWLQVFLSFFISAVFVSAVGPQNFVIAAVPWFAILLVCLFLIMALAGFVGGDFLKDNSKLIGWTFMILIVLSFVITGLFVFQPYYQQNGLFLNFADWLLSSRVAGAIILISISAAVAWVMVKVKAK